jgi:hypothetical protein
VENKNKVSKWQRSLSENKGAGPGMPYSVNPHVCALGAVQPFPGRPRDISLGWLLFKDYGMPAQGGPGAVENINIEFYAVLAAIL